MRAAIRNRRPGSNTKRPMVLGGSDWIELLAEMTRGARVSAESTLLSER
jgi:hypothetical protein